MILLSILDIFNPFIKSREKLSTSIYEYQIQALNSDELIDLSTFKGKKILFVNVASKCGFTNQYEDLQKLYDQHQTKLAIIGFPCNQFLKQEGGSEEKIAAFCQMNFGVTFPMTQKINVKGKKQHPIYKWLTTKNLNGKDNYKVSWNFNKFLVDEEGKLINHYNSKIEPFDQEIIQHLE